MTYNLHTWTNIQPEWLKAIDTTAEDLIWFDGLDSDLVDKAANEIKRHWIGEWLGPIRYEGLTLDVIFHQVIDELCFITDTSPVYTVLYNNLNEPEQSPLETHYESDLYEPEDHYDDEDPASGDYPPAWDLDDEDELTQAGGSTLSDKIISLNDTFGRIAFRGSTVGKEAPASKTSLSLTAEGYGRLHGVAYAAYPKALLNSSPSSLHTFRIRAGRSDVPTATQAARELVNSMVGCLGVEHDDKFISYTLTQQGAFVELAGPHSATERGIHTPMNAIARCDGNLSGTYYTFALGAKTYGSQHECNLMFHRLWDRVQRLFQPEQIGVAKLEWSMATARACPMFIFSLRVALI